MILKIEDPTLFTMETSSMELSLMETQFEVIKEMVIGDYQTRLNYDVDSIAMESTVSVFQRMGEFFKKMIEKIKEFFSTIMLHINSYLQELDRFCATYKDQLNKLDPEFTFMGYKYTIEDKVPDMSLFEKVVNDYNSSLSDVKSLKKDDIVKEHSQFLTTNNLNALRSQILGSNKLIVEEDFRDEIIKSFRNDSEDAVELEINQSFIRDIVSTSKQLVGDKNKCIRDKDKLITLLNKTENFFSRKIELVYRDVKYTEIKMNRVSIDDNKFSLSDEMRMDENQKDVLNALIKYKYDQARLLSTMINTVMLEKVNAYKDHIKQNSQILRKALSSPSKSEEDK